MTLKLMWLGIACAMCCIEEKNYFTDHEERKKLQRKMRRIFEYDVSM